MTSENKFQPRVLAIEVTRRCNLNCIHCRAESGETSPGGEITLDEYKKLFQDIASFAKPIIILTGGEPLLRPDILDIASSAAEQGFRVALSTNGTLVTEDLARNMVEVGVRSASISIDGSTAQIHDDFRKQPGAFEASLNGYRILTRAGMKVQVNTSLTKRNADDLDEIFKLVKKLDVAAWHVFMLVPMGRGEAIADKELIDAQGYEDILNYIYEKNRDEDFEIKPTCAPQYYRILRQRAKQDGIEVTVENFGLNARTRGCLAGMGFGFISWEGKVYPCGYYPSEAGDIRKQSFPEIWENSPLFTKLRDWKGYKGACGKCAFIRFCGGCRARALAVSGDDLAPEPYCIWGDENAG